MPFDSLYLNPRRVMIHPYTGETIICAACGAFDHPFDDHVVGFDSCDECGQLLVDCLTCERVLTCCRCGSYHSVDCPWPL
jgi:hypothetical protein